MLSLSKLSPSIRPPFGEYIHASRRASLTARLTLANEQVRPFSFPLHRPTARSRTRSLSPNPPLSSALLTRELQTFRGCFRIGQT